MENPNPNHHHPLAPPCWVLEFILRQPIPNHLLHALMNSLPPPPPSQPLPTRFQRAFLIRRLAGDPLSESSLLSLELLHQLNSDSRAYDSSPLTLTLIRSAYVHAAVGSTLNAGSPELVIDAVERTWGMRIGDLMESEASGLVSEELMEWKRRMEETEGEGLVMEWRREVGLAAVRAYLVKELEVMGPTVLEVAAEAHLSGTRTAEDVFQEFDDCDYEHDDNDIDDSDHDGGGRSMEGNAGGPVIREDEGVSGPLEGNSRLICGDNNEFETLDGLDTGEEAMIDGEVEKGGLSGSLNGVAGADCDFNVEGGEPETLDGLCRGEERTSGLVEQQEMVIQPIETVNRNCIVIQVEALGGVGEGEERNEGNVEQIDLATSSRGIDASISLVPTPEFNQVKENLRRSCKDLQNVVEDPLPDAKKAASRIIASKSNEAMHPSEQVEKHCLVYKSTSFWVSFLLKASFHYLANTFDLKEPEGNQRAAPLHSADDYEVLHTGSTSGDVELNKDRKKAPACSIMDRNSTARTYQWDNDSIESDSDRASSSSKKLHLPSPKTARVFPLKPVEFKKVSRRRKRWSVEEEDTLREAVNKYGKGNWKIMLNNYRDAFQERTEVDLKDKWRNMTKP